MALLQQTSVASVGHARPSVGSQDAPRIASVGFRRSALSASGLQCAAFGKKAAAPRVASLVRPICAVAGASASTSTEDVEFVWEGEAGEVLLTGDFLEWSSKVPLQRDSGKFVVKQKLPPGKYLFKFIVDGVWQHSANIPTVADGAGGLNNIVTVEEKKKAAPSPPPADEAPPAPPPTPKAEGAPAGKKVVGKAGGKKAAAKPIKEAMEEDIIPNIRAGLEKEEGLSKLELSFGNNVLSGQFVKNGIPYSFWAFFPDGILEGARGFSLTSYGNPPSTVEPFIIDEKKITPEIVVFWVLKRLFAQKLLSLN